MKNSIIRDNSKFTDMKKILKFGFCTLLLTMSFIGHAKDYYVSNDGDDNALGSSPEMSIQTLQKVNELNLKPGDRVLLKSGDIFTGTLHVKKSGKQGKPIVYGSYGTGEKPVINGFVEITGLEPAGKNIYSAECSKTIVHLYDEDELKVLARYPNEGYLTMDGGGNDHLVDYDLPFTSSEVKGAIARLQINKWRYKYRNVVEYKDKKLVFDSILAIVPDDYRICRQGWDYYLDGKKEFLDNENEWVYHPGEKRVYVYSNQPLDKSKEYLGSYVPCGIIVEKNVNHIVIKDLTFNGFSNTGVLIKGGNNDILVQGSTFEKINKYGVYVEERSERIHVKDNFFSDILGNGIRYFESVNCVIENNKMHNIGLVLGYGISGVNGATGICVLNREHPYGDKERLCHSNVIRKNHVARAGYNGIRFEGWNTTCEKNVVEDGLLTMHDGGLIYIWGKDTAYTFSNIIRNNIVMNGMSSLEKIEGKKLAVGIYLDNRVKDILVEDNIIYNAGSGVLSNSHSFRNTIKNNLIYGNVVGINLIEWDKPGEGNFAHVVTGNHVYCMKNLGSTLIVANHKDTVIDPGTIDNNLYCSPNEMFYIKKLIVGNGYKTEKNYTLATWQEELGYDENSVFLEPVKDGDYYPYSKLLINSTDNIKSFQLDNKYTWIDKEKNLVENEVVLQSRSAVVLFYR